MKTILTIVLFYAPFVVVAQSGYTTLTNALSRGDAATIADHFDERLEVTILAQSETMPKAKAKDALVGFFTKYQPSGFASQHQGNSKDNDAKYLVGTLRSGGKSFRVFILTREEGANLLIQQLQIEEN